MKTGGRTSSPQLAKEKEGLSRLLGGNPIPRWCVEFLRSRPPRTDFASNCLEHFCFKRFEWSINPNVPLACLFGTAATTL